MVSVITTLYYVAIIFHYRVWYIARFPYAIRVFEVRASSSSSRLPLCLFLLQPPLLSYSPWRKIAYSITHPAYLMPRNRSASASENE